MRHKSSSGDESWAKKATGEVCWARCHRVCPSQNEMTAGGHNDKHEQAERAAFTDPPPPTCCAQQSEDKVKHCMHLVSWQPLLSAIGIRHCLRKAAFSSRQLRAAGAPRSSSAQCLRHIFHAEAMRGWTRVATKERYDRKLHACI